MTALICSDNGLAFLRAHEGCILHVYRDAADVATIGYGHVLRPGDPIVVSIDDAESMLREDVASRIAAFGDRCTTTLTQSMSDALVSFAFNVGVGALAGSTLLRMLNARELAEAADQFLVWDKIYVSGALIVDPGLCARRRDERALFLRDGMPGPADAATS